MIHQINCIWDLARALFVPEVGGLIQCGLDLFCQWLRTVDVIVKYLCAMYGRYGRQGILVYAD